MKWICKSLQINKGSYGILNIDAQVNDKCYPTEFNLTTYSYVDCGGKHSHHNFTLTVKNALNMANALIEFKKKVSLTYKQEHNIRGKLFLLKIKDKMALTIGDYPDSLYSGNVYLDKKQAKKIAGYIFFWYGQYLIGELTLKINRKEKVLDINDILFKNKL